jgi:hypothetical protein
MRAATQLTRALRPFSLNPTGTLLRRHLAHFVAAVDTPKPQREAAHTLLDAIDEAIARILVSEQASRDSQRVSLSAGESREQVDASNVCRSPVTEQTRAD